MVYYRGFDIPETIDNFTKNIENSLMVSEYPCIMLNQRKGSVIIKAPFTIEDLERYKVTIDTLVEKCKCWIDFYLDQGGN